MFSASVEALYSLAYTIKFSLKKINFEVDYSVMPLEGLWWCNDMEHFVEMSKNDWIWTLMIMQPDFITSEMLDSAKEQVLKKKGLEKVKDVCLKEYSEIKAVQMLHIGPYSEETENIKKMHKYAKENNYELNLKHHEIYLSDPRRTEPSKLKTILRQPVK